MKKYTLRNTIENQIFIDIATLIHICCAIPMLDDIIMHPSSKCHCEDRYNAEECLRSQLHWNEPILLSFPVGGCRGLQTRAVVLCNDACHCVLERLAGPCQVFYARLDNLLAPLVDFFLLVDDIVRADNLLDCSLRNKFDLLWIEVHVIISVVHFLGGSLFYLI